MTLTENRRRQEIRKVMLARQVAAFDLTRTACEPVLATRYAQFAARWGRHAAVLLLAQNEDLLEVNTYSQWGALNRHVRHGQHGVWLLADDGELFAVFDVTQTEPVTQLHA